jgi:putative acetyltransferase
MNENATSNMNARIRVATKRDRDDIRDVHLQAFPAAEAEQIADLSVRLLTEASDPQTLNLIAVCHGKVAGHVAFSPVFSNIDKQWTGYILAPLAVRPEYHKAGIDSQLVENGMERLSEQGVNMLFVYGDPKFYQRFGFSAEAAAGFLPPYALQYPFGWQAIVLHAAPTEGHTVQLSCVASLRDPGLW